MNVKHCDRCGVANADLYNHRAFRPMVDMLNPMTDRWTPTHAVLVEITVSDNYGTNRDLCKDCAKVILGAVTSCLSK